MPSILCPSRKKNLTSDDVISKISISQERILISKNFDFYHSFILKREPYKILLVRVGNMKKSSVNDLILDNLESITGYFETGHMVEITRSSVKLLY